MKAKKTKKPKAPPDGESLRKSILGILLKFDPALVEKSGPPQWSHDLAAKVRREIQKRGLGDSGIELVNLILHDAEICGLGPFERLQLSRSLRVSASRLRCMRAKDFHRVEQILEHLHGRFSELAHCRDPQVLGGAVLFSGALHSSILIPRHLNQLLVRTKPIDAVMGLECIALDLVQTKSSARKKKKSTDEAIAAHPKKDSADVDNPGPAKDGKAAHSKRQVLHPATVYLLRRYRTLISASRAPTEAEALSAASRFLELEVIDLKKLTRWARGHRSIRLLSWLLEVMQNADLCPSLDDATWNRWMHGQRVEILKDAPPTSGLADGRLRREKSFGPELINGNRLRIATTALISTLRRKEADLRLDDQELTRRLEEWRSTHGQIGGWLLMLHDWVVAQSVGREGGAFASDHNLQPQGLLRYAGGFFHIFIEEVRLISIHHPVDIKALEKAIRRVVERIIVTKSPQPGCVGFRNFLHFLERTLHITPDLDEAFDVVCLPVNHRARVITPADYDEARLLIEQNHRSQPFEALRLKAALALGYRVGLRRSELTSREVNDFRLVTPRGHVIGDLYVHDTSDYDLKSRSSKRSIPLHVLLTPVEMAELYNFLDHRKTMLGASGWETDLLFGDVATPHKKRVDESLTDALANILRRVTCDHNVVFHDLRHSAASMLMLRLFDEGKLRGAFDGIPGYVRMRESFGPHLPLSNAFHGLHEEHPGRLYALARILGHQDPKTSLMFYVHTADIIIGATVRRFTPLPDDVQSLIDGIKPESVKRRERRRRAGASPRILRCKKKRKKSKIGENPRKRILGRHDHGLAGSYSVTHAVKILNGILSGGLSASRRKALRITEEGFQKVLDIADSGMMEIDSGHVNKVRSELAYHGSLAGFEVLVENVVRKRKSSWIAQVEALSEQPYRIYFRTREEAETRLEILQRNGLHAPLKIRPRKNVAADGSAGFELFVPGNYSKPIMRLLPMFMFIALRALDAAAGPVPGSSA